jgi:AcrR family transcriptional regulator
MAQAPESQPAPGEHPPDRAKCRQIMDGARQVFLERGFDAASMGEIARQAGVSKGTLYVYFQSKEELFERIFEEESRAQAEQVFSLDPNDRDVEAVLRRLGCGFARFICDPSRLSSHRTVISIAERMPTLGKRFFMAGPATGVAKVSRYLEAQAAAGVLEIPDSEVAAAQFLDSCLSTMFKPMMFASAPSPTEERIAHVVDSAVKVFMAAYAAGARHRRD